MYLPPRNDLEYSRTRLDKIMARRRLSFNPYTISDEKLLELAGKTGWGNEWDIAQMTIATFTRLRLVDDFRKFDGIYMRLSFSGEEIFLYSSMLTSPVITCGPRNQIRTTIGSKQLRHPQDMQQLVGKTVFISRIIRGRNSKGDYRGAYRMHRLYGDVHKKASVIRSAMISAKIEMLERILDVPESPDLLDCSRGFFDYETRIRQAITLIRTYPRTPVPPH